MQFIGIDLHTNRFTCRRLSESGKEKSMVAFELDKTICLGSTPPHSGTVVLIKSAVNAFLFRPLVKCKTIYS